MNAKTCKRLRRLAGTRHEKTRYADTGLQTKYAEVPDMNPGPDGRLPTNDDGTPKMTRFEFQVVLPIRLDERCARARYKDMKRGGTRSPTFASTGLSIRVLP